MPRLITQIKSRQYSFWKSHEIRQIAACWVFTWLWIAYAPSLFAQSPTSIAGYMVRGTITTGSEAGEQFENSFRSDLTYANIAGNGGGTYTHTKLATATARLALTRAYPADGAGDRDAVTLTFNTATNGTFKNSFVSVDGATGSVDGTFSVSKLPPLITSLGIQPQVPQAWWVTTVSTMMPVILSAGGNPIFPQPGRWINATRGSNLFRPQQIRPRVTASGMVGWPGVKRIGRHECM